MRSAVEEVQQHSVNEVALNMERIGAILAAFALISNGICGDVSNEEIINIAKELRKTDLETGHIIEVVLNLQNSTTTCRHDDPSKERLFENFNEAALQSDISQQFIRTVKAFVEERKTTDNEVQILFGLIVQTKVFQKLYKLLKQQEIAENFDSFVTYFHELWFEKYTRKRRDSSGFQHVFLGEVHRTKIGGFHNWIRFYVGEKDDSVNYKGYVAKECDPHLLGVRFAVNGVEKPLNSMLIGVSIEFEMALYTLCFATRPGKKCRVEINGCPVPIQTFIMRRRNKLHVGSAYTIANPLPCSRHEYKIDESKVFAKEHAFDEDDEQYWT